MSHIKITNPPRKTHPNWVLWYLAGTQTLLVLLQMVR